MFVQSSRYGSVEPKSTIAVCFVDAETSMISAGNAIKLKGLVWNCCRFPMGVSEHKDLIVLIHTIQWWCFSKSICYIYKSQSIPVI